MVTAEPYVWCEQPSKLEGRNANPWQRTNSEFARAAFVLVCATFRIVVYSVLTQCVESDALHPVTPYNDSVLLARLDSAGRDKLSGDLNGRYKDLLSENGQHMRDLKAGQLLANQSPLLCWSSISITEAFAAWLRFLLSKYWRLSRDNSSLEILLSAFSSTFSALLTLGPAVCCLLFRQRDVGTLLRKMQINCGRKSEKFWAPSAAHQGKLVPQNLKGVIAFASTLGLLLQALPCRGFRSDAPAFACSRYTLVAEHGERHFNRRFVAAQDDRDQGRHSMRASHMADWAAKA
jgi:hypothetical protein